MDEQRNVLGDPLQSCGSDPVTGFYRDEYCTVGPEDVGVHGVCSVVSAEFLAHQQETGNDLITPRPEYAFTGLRPGDRWCVVAQRWLLSYAAGVAAPVVLASTSDEVLRFIPIAALRELAVDVPDSPSDLL